MLPQQVHGGEFANFIVRPYKNLKYHIKFVPLGRKAWENVNVCITMVCYGPNQFIFPLCHKVPVTVGKIKLVTLPGYKQNFYRQMLSHSAKNQCIIMVQLLRCKDNNNDLHWHTNSIMMCFVRITSLPADTTRTCIYTTKQHYFRTGHNRALTVFQAISIKLCNRSCCIYPNARQL